MKYFRLGESEELIKEARGIDIDNNKKQNTKKIEKIRKELEKQVKTILFAKDRKGRKVNAIEKVIDYTEWQKNLYNDMDVETFGKMSCEYCKNN